MRLWNRRHLLFSNMKIYRLTILITLFAFIFKSYGQIIVFPDANFKLALTNFNVVDTNGNGIPDSDADLNNDGEIEVSEAVLVEHLYITEFAVSDLTGIENFVNIETLVCWQNSISIIDVSNLADLKYLDCNTNLISSIDLTNNLNLKHLDLGINSLSGHIDLNPNVDLRKVYLSQNDITSISIDQLSLLEDIVIQSADLGTLNLSGNPLVTRLALSSNNLTSIDLATNTELIDLTLSSNLLSEIDLSINFNLEVLLIRENKLTNLDLSNNSQIAFVRCDVNQLESLNIKNGNNEILNIFDATMNPDLFCIQVDDKTYANSIDCNGSGQPSWCKDSQSNYQDDCNLSTTSFENEYFRVIPNPFTDQIEIISTHEGIDEFTLFDVNGRKVYESSIASTTGLSSLSPGIYFLVSGKRTLRLIKSR